MVKNGYFILLIFVLLTSCTRVEITRDYIYNSKWGGQEGNGFDRIVKVYFDIDLVDLDNIDVNTLSRNYKVDSTFCYQFYAPNAKSNKAYFNRENNGGGFFRKLCDNDLATKVKTIGTLELNSWYLIANINSDTIHFVYIDKKGKSHIYKTYDWGPW